MCSRTAMPRGRGRSPSPEAASGNAGSWCQGAARCIAGPRIVPVAAISRIERGRRGRRAGRARRTQLGRRGAARDAALPGRSRSARRCSCGAARAPLGGVGLVGRPGAARARRRCGDEHCERLDSNPASHVEDFAPRGIRVRRIAKRLNSAAYPKSAPRGNGKSTIVFETMQKRTRYWIRPTFVRTS